MTPALANQHARELAKTYIEHQNVHIAQMDAKTTGEYAAEMIIAMIARISTFLEKSGS